MQRGPVDLVRRNEVERAVLGFFGDWVELFGAIVRVLRLEERELVQGEIAAARPERGLGSDLVQLTGLFGWSGTCSQLASHDSVCAISHSLAIPAYPHRLIVRVEIFQVLRLVGRNAEVVAKMAGLAVRLAVRKG